jgi:hypothetical protein
MSYEEMCQKYPIGLVLDLKGRYMVGDNRYKKSKGGEFGALRTDEAGLASALNRWNESKARRDAKQRGNLRRA